MDRLARNYPSKQRGRRTNYSIARTPALYSRFLDRTRTQRLLQRIFEFHSMVIISLPPRSLRHGTTVLGDLQTSKYQICRNHLQIHWQNRFCLDSRLPADAGSSIYRPTLYVLLSPYPLSFRRSLRDYPLAKRVVFSLHKEQLLYQPPYQLGMVLENKAV